MTLVLWLYLLLEKDTYCTLHARAFHAVFVPISH